MKIRVVATNTLGMITYENFTVSSSSSSNVDLGLAIGIPVAILFGCVISILACAVVVLLGYVVFLYGKKVVVNRFGIPVYEPNLNDVLFEDHLKSPNVDYQVVSIVLMIVII